MSAQPALTHNWFGDRVWRVNGIPHREDGPARVWPDGEAEWWPWVEVSMDGLANAVAAVDRSGDR